jgi:hypothetical protein
MRNYLESKKGERLGIIRAGMPKEVYFEAKVKELRGEVVILENDQGEELALPVEKIILVGPCEEEPKSRAGF